MTVSATNAARINKMNRASQDASLGTEVRNLGLVAPNIAIVAGSLVAGGSQVVIQTGLSASPVGLIFQANASGSIGSVPLYASAGSVVGTYVITSASDAGALGATDVITWISWSA